MSKLQLNKKHIKFFDLARKLSRKSEYEHKLGAVIVQKNKVIEYRFNQPYKTHTKTNNRFATIHAELHAILSTRQKDLKGAIIYVYRETKHEVPANSKPCTYCQSLIEKFNIKRVFYTTDGYFNTYEV